MTELYCKANGNYLIPDVWGIFADLRRGLDVTEIAIPADAKRDSLCLWEYGGLNISGKGIAMIVAEPDGSPIKKPILFQRKAKPNGRHGLAMVWPGCYTAMAFTDKGTTTTLVYRVCRLSNVDMFNYNEKFKDNGVVILEKVAASVSTFRSSDVDVVQGVDQVAIVNLIQAVESKVLTQDATNTCYMSVWDQGNRKNTSHVRWFNSVNADNIEALPNKVVSCMGNLVMLAEGMCKANITKMWMPVRVMTRKTDTGYDVYAAIMSEPEKDSEDLLAVKAILKTSIKENSSTARKEFLENHIFLAGAKNYAEFEKLMSIPENKDNWIFYKGC